MLDVLCPRVRIVLAWNSSLLSFAPRLADMQVTSHIPETGDTDTRTKIQAIIGRVRHGLLLR